MKNNKLTFRQILDNFEPDPMSYGEVRHIISKMITERTAKGKKDKLYKLKHKGRLGNESFSFSYV